ncbi:hypothetical protein H072_630 [Dactylellina haptotyla CBS 200.50]|uniref:Uncharacterized protein n=1 Tax=Dactylellina haptotyla (strain CBS 200.50) TaxID=1284197 RepID=S8C0Y9_DACHA|nr:hypothetical protein H072_630 [Dactylellina haptotyla CBS 200.50]
MREREQIQEVIPHGGSEPAAKEGHKETTGAPQRANTEKEEVNSVEVRYAALTEQEREVVGILSNLKDTKVELIDRETSESYFKAIEEVLIMGNRDETGMLDVRRKLNRLRWQYFWLDRFRATEEAAAT